MNQVNLIGEYSESPELAVTIAYFPFDLIDVFGLMMSSHMCVSVHTYTCWLCCPVSSCPMSNLCVFCPNRISSNGAFHFRCKWIQWNSIKIRYSAETILLCFLTTCRIFLSSFGITCFFVATKSIFFTLLGFWLWNSTECVCVCYDGQCVLDFDLKVGTTLGFDD